MSSRVVVFGYGEPALTALDTFATLSIKPVAVVVPGNRHGAGVELVRSEAERRSYPALTQPARTRIAPFLEQIRQLQPDFLFVWSYSMLLPPELLTIAARSAINLHAGSLPDYRGGHVLNWAIINGERDTAATLHLIDAGIDSGPVIAERRLPIADDEDVATVYRRLIAAGVSLLREWWPRIESGQAQVTPQDESRARYYRMRTPDDGRVDWRQSSLQIHNLVRALAAPWPGAFSDVNGTRLVWRKVTPIDVAAAARPGHVVHCGAEGVVIGTGGGLIRADCVEIGGLPASIPALRASGVLEGVTL